MTARIKVATDGTPVQGQTFEKKKSTRHSASKPYAKREKSEQLAAPVFSKMGIRRNAKCPCGSGQRFKDCHLQAAKKITMVPEPEYTGNPDIVNSDLVQVG